MGKHHIFFPYERYLAMLDEATETKTVVAVITLAMAQRSNNRLSDTYLANILRLAGDKIYSFI